MVDTPFIGYSGAVWQHVYSSIAYYTDSVNAAAASGDPAAVSSLSIAMLQTLSNAGDAIVAYDYYNSWTTMAGLLEDVAALPLVGVSPTAAEYFGHRLTAYSVAASAIYDIVPQAPFPQVQTSLNVGEATIPNPNYLAFLKLFDYEAAPTGLTAANFAASTIACAQAFTDVANAVAVFQGQFPNQLYDVVHQQALIAGEVADFVNSFSSSGVSSGSTFATAWSQVAAMPALTMTGSFYTTAPYLYQNQQSQVIRYAMALMTKTITLFLANLQNPVAVNAATAQLLQNESLPDLANRTLGDYTRWTEIATLNGLSPPWVGVTPASGIATPGQRLLIPTPGTAPSSTGAAPSYNVDVLGTDIYIGEINGNMPEWTGDLQTITGISNLAISLGRRLQTALSTLIFHPEYGSRLPMEVGQIQDQVLASQVNAFGAAALQSDPRVAAVLSATSSLTSPVQLAFQGVVRPIGDKLIRATVNTVINSGGPS